MKAKSYLKTLSIIIFIIPIVSTQLVDEPIGGENLQNILINIFENGQQDLQEQPAPKGPQDQDADGIADCDDKNPENGLCGCTYDYKLEEFVCDDDPRKPTVECLNGWLYTGYACMMSRGDANGDFIFDFCDHPIWANDPINLDKWTRPLPAFFRGDVNQDNHIDISDGIAIINYLFISQEEKDKPNCLDAADLNDNEKIDITDAVYLFNYLFQGTNPPIGLKTKENAERDCNKMCENCNFEDGCFNRCQNCEDAWLDYTFSPTKRLPMTCDASAPSDRFNPESSLDCKSTPSVNDANGFPEIINVCDILREDEFSLRQNGNPGEDCSLIDETKLPHLSPLAPDALYFLEGENKESRPTIFIGPSSEMHGFGVTLPEKLSLKRLQVKLVSGVDSTFITLQDHFSEYNLKYRGFEAPDEFSTPYKNILFRTLSINELFLGITRGTINGKSIIWENLNKALPNSFPPDEFHQIVITIFTELPDGRTAESSAFINLMYHLSTDQQNPIIIHPAIGSGFELEGPAPEVIQSSSCSIELFSESAFEFNDLPFSVIGDFTPGIFNGDLQRIRQTSYLPHRKLLGTMEQHFVNSINLNTFLPNLPSNIGPGPILAEIPISEEFKQLINLPNLPEENKAYYKSLKKRWIGTPFIGHHTQTELKIAGNKNDYYLTQQKQATIFYPDEEPKVLSCDNWQEQIEGPFGLVVISNSLDLPVSYHYVRIGDANNKHAGFNGPSTCPDRFATNIAHLEPSIRSAYYYGNTITGYSDYGPTFTKTSNKVAKIAMQQTQLTIDNFFNEETDPYMLLRLYQLGIPLNNNGKNVCSCILNYKIDRTSATLLDEPDCQEFDLKDNLQLG
jgi:hypothetical protein